MAQDETKIPAFLSTGTVLDQNTEQGDIGDQVADAVLRDIQTLSGSTAKPPLPAATPELVQQADVPSFSATDGLARDLMTKIGQGEQRMSEMEGDIANSKTYRDTLVSQANADLEEAIELTQKAAQDTIWLMKRNAEKQIAFIDNNHLQEVAIIRGRQADEAKGLKTLQATVEMLKRK